MSASANSSGYAASQIGTSSGSVAIRSRRKTITPTSRNALHSSRPTAETGRPSRPSVREMWAGSGLGASGNGVHDADGRAVCGRGRITRVVCGEPITICVWPAHSSSSVEAAGARELAGVGDAVGVDVVPPSVKAG